MKSNKSDIKSNLIRAQDLFDHFDGHYLGFKNEKTEQAYLKMIKALSDMKLAFDNRQFEIMITSLEQLVDFIRRVDAAVMDNKTERTPKIEDLPL